jgi:hypothetical protein
MLAITALDVAFISAIATIVAAIASPAISLLISRESLAHEVKLERESRLHDAQRSEFSQVQTEFWWTVVNIDQADREATDAEKARLRELQKRSYEIRDRLSEEMRHDVRGR